jgi:drug/metabolite transporter (DMT)-like permease
MWALVLGGLSVAAMWALSPVLYKCVLPDLSPSMLLVLVTWASAAVVTVYAVARRAQLAPEWARITWTHLGIVLLTALLGTLAANLIFYALLQQHSSGVVTAIAFSAPVFTALLAFLILGEPLGWMDAVGVALVVAGVGFVCAAR